MSVVLVLPFLEEAGLKNAFRQPECLAIGYLAAFLRHQDIHVDTINGELQQLSVDDIAKTIVEGTYEVVGISCTAQRIYPICLKLASELRKFEDSFHITMGGHFASVAHKEIMEETEQFDSIVRGEGELTLLQLIRHILQNADLSDVAGLTYRKNGNVFINPDRERIHDLDAVPFPDRDDLPVILRYIQAGVMYAKITASRGCYGNCTFCSVRKAYNSPLRICRSPSNIVNELKYLQDNWGVSHFEFVDEIFLDGSKRSRKWVQEFCNELDTKGVSPIRFEIQVRSGDVDYTTFELLAAHGLADAIIGVESGVDSILSRYNKNVSVKDNEKAIQVLEKLGVGIRFGFIMFDPRTTFEELKENFQWLKKVGHYTKYNLLNRLNVYYGTQVWNELKKLGLFNSKSFHERGPYRYLDKKTQKVSLLMDRMKKLMLKAEKNMITTCLALRETHANLFGVESRGENNLPDFMIGYPFPDWKPFCRLDSEFKELAVKELVIWTKLFEEALRITENSEEEALPSLLDTVMSFSKILAVKAYLLHNKIDSSPHTLTICKDCSEKLIQHSNFA